MRLWGNKIDNSMELRDSCDKNGQAKQNREWNSKSRK